MKGKEVCICCVAEDILLAEEIKERLGRYHIDSLISRTNNDFLSCLDGVAVFVLLFSRYSSKSTIVDNLLSEAVGRRLRIVPFNVDGTSIADDPTWDFQLRKAQWVLGYPDRDKQMDNLVVSVCRFLGRDAIQEAPTDPFEQLKRGIALEYGTNFLEENRKEAMLWLERSAEQGNLEAMMELYRFFKNSEDDNIFLDYKKADRWLRKACDGGHAEAQWLIATQYDMFTGKYTLDEVVRLDLLESSYSKGNKRAAYSLAMLLEEKDIDPSRVFELVKEASILNDNVIWDKLGMMYWKGYGTDVNDTEAVRCFKNANWYGLYHLAMAYYYGRGIAQDYRKAYEIVSNPNDLHGDPRKHFMIGECLEYGRGVEINIAKAAKSYLEAYKWFTTNGNSYYSYERGIEALSRAAKIDAESQYKLGKDLFDTGEVQKALSYFTKAANGGLPAAMYYCGIIYYYGIGVREDIKKAKYWLEKADIPGIPEASVLLGDIYIYEETDTADTSRILNLYLRAAEQNNSTAEYKLSLIYSEDEQTSQYWRERAFNHGYENNCHRN